MTHTLRIIVAGLGNVNLNLLRILRSQRDILTTNYHLNIVVVAALDSQGGALNANGLDIDELIAAKEAKRSVATTTHGKPGLDTLQALAQVSADALVEATPVNLVDGEPALSAVKTALLKGMHAILANKAPLALLVWTDCLNKCTSRDGPSRWFAIAMPHSIRSLSSKGATYVSLTYAYCLQIFFAMHRLHAMPASFAASQ